MKKTLDLKPATNTAILWGKITLSMTSRRQSCLKYWRSQARWSIQGSTTTVMFIVKSIWSSRVCTVPLWKKSRAPTSEKKTIRLRIRLQRGLWVAKNFLTDVRWKKSWVSLKTRISRIQQERRCPLLIRSSSRASTPANSWLSRETLAATQWKIAATMAWDTRITRR